MHAWLKGRTYGTWFIFPFYSMKNFLPTYYNLSWFHELIRYNFFIGNLFDIFIKLNNSNISYTLCYHDSWILQYFFLLLWNVDTIVPFSPIMTSGWPRELFPFYNTYKLYLVFESIKRKQILRKMIFSYLIVLWKIPK